MWLKNRKLFLIIIPIVTLGAGISFYAIKNFHYNKDHFFIYSTPATFGNGSNGIVIVSEDWKIIPFDNKSDLVLWRAAFRNTSTISRKLYIFAHFKDESSMEILSDSASENGRLLKQDEAYIFNGKTLITKSMSRRLKFIELAITSSHKEIENTILGIE